MGNASYPYEPDYAVAPGETLQETIAALDMDQKELATRLGMSEKHVSQIMNGKAPITYETANKLELVTGVPARMWNNLEMQYRERLARIEAAKSLAADLEWLKRVPTKELIARQAIQARKDRGELLREVLAFFGVSSVEAWKQLWLKPQAAYRRSRCFDMNPEATATWLRLGELAAQKINCGPYDRGRFRAVLDEIRPLTLEGPREFQPKLAAMCAAVGVAIVFVPEIRGCPASGVARWLSPDKALIQLSLRHKTDDHLWFSFFHEAAHVLNDPKKDVYIDDGSAATETREKRADTFSAAILVPSHRASELPNLKTRVAVTRFASAIGIAAGIVVGRLQHDRVIPHSYLNDLKRRFQWSA